MRLSSPQVPLAIAKRHCTLITNIEPPSRTGETMNKRDIELYLYAAEQLGQDYPAREPADLQGFLRVMWTLLTSEQQRAFADCSAVRDTLEASLTDDDDGDGLQDRKTGEVLSWLDVESYVEAARQHGEDSEPDHESGDLQDYLRAMWKLLTPTQQAAFGECSEVLNRIKGASLPPDVDAQDSRDATAASHREGAT